MKDAKDLIPWEVTDISIRPYDGYWSFNPSIHFDGSTWRCVLRCCDYAMPGGVTIRSKTARPTGQQTKNAMVLFDPQSWKPIQIYSMHERDDFPRVSTPHVGYEDMRLFKTDKGGLQGIAASLHLKRSDKRVADGSPHNQPPEQVLLSFDGEYNIVGARPIRGDGWSGTPQKNWVPFDHCAEPRFLYSIDKGALFDEGGSVHGDRAAVLPSTVARPLGAVVAPQAPAPQAPVPQQSDPQPPALPPPSSEPSSEQRAVLQRGSDRAPRRHPDLRTRLRGGDVQVLRGRKMMLDSSTVRPAPRASSRPPMARAGSDASRAMSAGRAHLPKYDGLRGGTQLVRVGDDAWLGIGHEMKFVNSKKLYWHTWYLVDSMGKLTSVSEPMKLAVNWIEFAAGMAIDGDRVVVSFGVDDMECKIGETRLSAVMESLRPIVR